MTDANKVSRFYPLDAVAANGMLHRPGTYTVRYYDNHWRVRELEVVAVDEMGAFAAAQHILKSKQGWSLSDLPTAARAVIVAVIGGILGSVAAVWFS